MTTPIWITRDTEDIGGDSDLDFIAFWAEKPELGSDGMFIEPDVEKLVYLGGFDLSEAREFFGLTLGPGEIKRVRLDARIVPTEGE